MWPFLSGDCLQPYTRNPSSNVLDHCLVKVLKKINSVLNGSFSALAFPGKEGRKGQLANTHSMCFILSSGFPQSSSSNFLVRNPEK